MTFTVDDISHATFVYDASQNVQTTITVPKPAAGQSPALASAWASLGLATFFLGGIASVRIRRRPNNN